MYLGYLPQCGMLQIPSKVIALQFFPRHSLPVHRRAYFFIQDLNFIFNLVKNTSIVHPLLKLIQLEFVTSESSLPVLVFRIHSGW